MPAPSCSPAPRPCAPAGFAPAGLSAARPDLPAALSQVPLLPQTMLLVEDSRLAAEAVRLLCRRLGVRLRRADSLELAQAHLRVYRPDVLLVDPGLPDGSGLSLIAALGRAHRRPARVIGFSGDPGMEGACLQAGADAFIAKPLQPARHLQSLFGAHVIGSDCAALVAAACGDVALTRASAAIESEGEGTLGTSADLMCVQPRATDPTGAPADARVIPARAAASGAMHRNHGADPLALQDDLRLARAMIGSARAGARIDYTARFLRGIARCANDTDLMQAAETALSSQSPAPLIAALDHRMRRNLDCI